MKYILLNQVNNNENQKVIIKGWLFNFRSSGKIAFLQIRDGFGEIQAVVIKNEVVKKTFDIVNQLTLETSLEIEGVIKKEPRSFSGYDLLVSNLSIIHKAEDDYPIGKKEHGISFLLDNRHLWLRSKRQRAILTVRNQVIQAVYNFFETQGFLEIDTPILTPNACEGTTTLFEIDYFGEPAYLSQSGQLYLEAAISSFGKCFDFSPVFRAEKSKTRRHLIEFWMTNAEAAFVDHQQNLEIQEKMVMHIIKRVLENCQKELEIIERDAKKLEAIKIPFRRLSYKQVIQKLKKLGSKTQYGSDLGNEDETLLMKQYDQPLFIEYYPAQVKAFYMKRHPQNNSLALCGDLLAPEGYGEIIGGSQREDDYDVLLKSIKQHNLPLIDFGWYLDLRKYGSVPHSGFGLGIERIITWICGLKHVRETIPFPRLLNRLRP